MQESNIVEGKRSEKFHSHKTKQAPCKQVRIPKPSGIGVAASNRDVFILVHDKLHEINQRKWCEAFCETNWNFGFHPKR